MLTSNAIFRKTKNVPCSRLHPKRRPFLVVGHAGGDPEGHCENTLEATRSALDLGANAIEVDVAVSRDKVAFLWHDPYPLGLHSLARR